MGILGKGRCMDLAEMMHIKYISMYYVHCMWVVWYLRLDFFLRCTQPGFFKI